MNFETVQLTELCSRKLLDMYKTAEALSLKSAIEAVLTERKHFTDVVNKSHIAH